MTGTRASEVIFINESFYADSISPAKMDILLSRAWRHFGNHFYRYNLSLYDIYDDDIRRVLPLRVRLEDFSFSKSQRRTLRRNSDLRCEIRPIQITDESNDLFDRHRVRFKHSVPDSIYCFLSSEPATEPTPASELAVYDENRLVAISYFDEGVTATSGIYAAFDPEMPDRRLGIFTMLKEIEYSIETGRSFYYPGFAYEGESFYDYKKRFRALEVFDWRDRWLPYVKGT
ncbi:MAG: arginine-tRNA-protein transferase [Acidobacteria bacterium]|nr:putative arginyl-tRNA--protein transferase [Pyrinomonadaceae bacterium]RIJ94522.1 MAG: arginine-tRNA-protein transferase [Acidobacteriota bacterium]